MNNVDDHVPTIEEYENLREYLERSVEFKRKSQRERKNMITSVWIDKQLAKHIREDNQRLAFLDQVLTRMKEEQT